MIDRFLEDFFSSSGPLAKRFRGYEFRPQQLELALGVRDFLRAPSEALMAAEAPTGVGKTFAVLVPTLHEAEEENKHILFLTASIALQEQLIDKDLPKLASLLGNDFSYGLLKGRGNYACLRRAALANTSAAFLPFEGVPAVDEGKNVDIERWLQETETGDFSELSLSRSNPELTRIAASADNCLGVNCPFHERCFVMRSFRQAQDWQVTVANYHLFFSHLLSKKGSFPVRYNWLICDEAHRIPDAARSSATIEASVRDGLTLLRPRTIQSFDSLLESNGVDAELFKERAAICRDALESLFALSEVRYPRGGGIATSDEEVVHKGDELAEALNRLLEMLRAMEDRFMSGDFEDRVDLGEAAALIRWIDGVKDFKKAVLWCLKVSDFPSWAYWRKEGSLVSAPVTCADIISTAMEANSPQKSIMLSATLSLAGKFDFWSGETGLTPDKSMIVTSPFNLKSQMEIDIVDLGLSVGAPGYDEKVCRVLVKLCNDNGGRTLILLSSIRLLQYCAQKMKAMELGYSVLTQGELSQRELLRRFREDETSVLIGSVSFREGVDVPGEGLTQVIIDRIPFSHPQDPLVQARNVLTGNKGFVLSTLPSAKMFLRQAVGRLIRASHDHGRVVLLDVRALARPDWKILESFPDCPRRRLTVKKDEF